MEQEDTASIPLLVATTARCTTPTALKHTRETVKHAKSKGAYRNTARKRVTHQVSHCRPVVEESQRTSMETRARTPGQWLGFIRRFRAGLYVTRGTNNTVAAPASLATSFGGTLSIGTLAEKVANATMQNLDNDDEYLMTTMKMILMSSEVSLSIFLMIMIMMMMMSSEVSNFRLFIFRANT